MVANTPPDHIIRTGHDTRLTVTIPEACRMLGISRATVYRLMDNGDLQSRRILGRRVVLVSSIREIVEHGVAK